MRIKNRVYAVAAAASAAALLVTGCSSGDSNDNAASATPTTSAASPGDTAVAGDCATPSGKVTDANHQPGEPTFGLLTLPGWDRVTSADSDVVRLAVRNADLQSGNFSPNAVVTVEKSPVSDIESETERQIDGLKQSTVSPTDIKTEAPTTTCGFPSQTLTYSMKNQAGSMSSVTATIFMVPNATGSTVAVLTMQTTEPDNEEYQAAVKQMIEEFQIEK
ncbi:hypothetical protein [Gordonia sp. (in: high G+C Gram-positive bacteria)]|uniref:hypothetical protein n=1 Tax=Gordonia sp. (in: high G+C Gram-positive bacteria) TaxID=84139 RepID=UPI003C741E34